MEATHDRRTNAQDRRRQVQRELMLAAIQKLNAESSKTAESTDTSDATSDAASPAAIPPASPDAPAPESVVPDAQDAQDAADTSDAAHAAADDDEHEELTLPASLLPQGSVVLALRSTPSSTPERLPLSCGTGWSALERLIRTRNPGLTDTAVLQLAALLFAASRPRLDDPDVREVTPGDALALALAGAPKKLVDRWLAIMHAGEVSPVATGDDDDHGSAADLLKRDADGRLRLDDVLAATLARAVLATFPRTPDLRVWFDVADWRRTWREAQTGDSETWLSILAKMLASGPYRRLPALPSPRAFDRVMHDYPNAVEPIRFVRNQVAAARLSKSKRLDVPPILLAGPPGVGKSAVARAIAEVLGMHLLPLPMAGASVGWVISGLHASWRGGRSGRIFDRLVGDESIAFAAFADEIDKAATTRDFDPTGALLQALEQNDALRFVDEAVQVPVDASHVVWFAAANDVTRIPGPLLSRFEVFEIAAPDPDQMVRIAESIWRALVAGDGLDASLPRELPDAFRGAAAAAASVRELNTALRRAVGTMAFEVAEGVPVTHGIELGQSSRRRGIGFVG